MYELYLSYYRIYYLRFFVFNSRRMSFNPEVTSARIKLSPDPGGDYGRSIEGDMDSI